MTLSSSHIKQNEQAVAEPAFGQARAGSAMISGQQILEWYRVLPNETRGYARWIMVSIFPVGIKGDSWYLTEHFDDLKRKIDGYPNSSHEQTFV
jgi:hypothetical protein